MQCWSIEADYGLSDGRPNVVFGFGLFEGNRKRNRTETETVTRSVVAHKWLLRHVRTSIENNKNTNYSLCASVGTSPYSRVPRIARRRRKSLEQAVFADVVSFGVMSC